jgi:hypothetical protein
MKKIVLAIVLFVLWANGVQAQTDKPGLLQLLGIIGNTEEHLFHLVRVGPYTVSADGNRLLEHPYIKFEIKQSGVAIPAGSQVRLETKLYTFQGEGEIDGKIEALLATAQPVQTKSYALEYDGRYFIADPLDLELAKTWDWNSSGYLQMQLFIAAPTGTTQGQFGMAIYPSRPSMGNGVKAAILALPFICLGLFLGAFRLFKLRLTRPLAQSTDFNLKGN